MARNADDAAAMRSVARNPRFIAGMPDEAKTEAVCLAAVWGWEDAMQWVPEKAATKRVCMAAAGSGHGMKWIPKRLLTKEMCLRAVEADGWNLAYVPEEFKGTNSRAMPSASTAVRQSAWASRSWMMTGRSKSTAI